MITVEECKKYLEPKNLSDERIEEIRDYLYAISREVIRNNVSDYKKALKQTKVYG